MRIIIEIDESKKDNAPTIVTSSDTTKDKLNTSLKSIDSSFEDTDAGNSIANIEQEQTESLSDEENESLHIIEAGEAPAL